MKMKRTQPVKEERTNAMKGTCANISSIAQLESLTEQSQQYLLGFEDNDSVPENTVIEYPYDPEKIRVESKIFPIFQIKSMINKKTLLLRPEFQRNTVWDNVRKSRLIESLMLRIPIPAFYFDEDNDGKKTVIDGLQRLTAINSYMDDAFELVGLQYLQEECGDKRFSNLQQKYRTRIEDAQLTVNILDPRSPANVKFDIFRRVNTGGVPLNAQEIRNVLANEETRHFLISMAKSEEFLRATRSRINDIRMDAQELCLRFIAFFTHYDREAHRINNVASVGTMLDKCVLELNEKDENELNEILTVFRSSMDKCHALFGEKAFSKPNNEHIINKVLFTSWAVTLTGYDYPLSRFERLQGLAVDHLYKRLEDDPEYFTSISSSTSTKKSIKKQFQTAYEIMEGLLHAQ